jgi:cell cycle checkpoint protein
MIGSLQLSKPPVFDLTSSQSKPSPQSSIPSPKGKAKAQPEVADDNENSHDALWLDTYEPLTQVRVTLMISQINIDCKALQDELAVHSRKINDVQQWFLEAFEGGSSGKLRKYRVCLFVYPCLMQLKNTAENLGSHWTCWCGQDCDHKSAIP